jgi:hypothetical protein
MSITYTEYTIICCELVVKLEEGIDKIKINRQDRNKVTNIFTRDIKKKVA